MVRITILALIALFAYMIYGIVDMSKEIQSNLTHRENEIRNQIGNR